MKLGKRLAGILLALLLIVGLMPATASAGSDDSVNISDEKFRALLNDQLGDGRAEDAPITEAEMESLKYLSISSSSDVTNIEGIQYAVNLETLYVSGNIQGVGQIAELTQLTSLSILNNDQLTDLSVLGEKPSLRELNVTGCSQLVSLEGLSAYPALISLRVGSGSAATDIKGIEDALALEKLYMTGDIQNMGSIRGLTKLTSLSILDNGCLTDLSEMGGKPDLTALNLSGCEQLVSLDGLEGAPGLESLDCSRCNALSDISVLGGQKFDSLKELDLEGENSLVDLTPLKGYTSLETLNLEKVEITPENREGYRETIRSLTGLAELNMTFCEMTDADTEMFSPLKDLQELILNMNNLTDTGFCDQLPEGIETLSLYGNQIADMDNLSRLENLQILGMGNNQVTDFSFISELKDLTDGYVRHAEGEEGHPMLETYYYGQEDPIKVEDGRVVIKNPYIGVDEKPVSFAGAEVSSSENADVTVSYDERTNQITIMNPDDSVTIQTAYDLPVSGGDVKVGRLRIQVYAEEEKTYTIRYDWGEEAPEGQTLPSNTSEYQTLEEAQAAVDNTFTSQTVVKGEKDGTEGVWRFSGWTVTVDGTVVKATGQWTFEAHQHQWGQPAYTWSQDGTTCAATRVCAEDGSHVESETVGAVSQVAVPATCTAMGKTSYTADFASDWAETQTRVLENIEKLPHSWNEQWGSDESGHWHGCSVCGTQKDQSAHFLVWVVDREATATEDGSRHQECSVCGYARKAVVIPATGTPEAPQQPETPGAGGGQTEKPEAEAPESNIPQTGDTSRQMFWVLLGAAAAGGLGAALWEKGRRERQ